MKEEPLDIVILGLSITSSWGNGHATTYRGLVRELVRRGHDVLFLERDTPWYAAARDLPRPPYCRTELYRSFGELDAIFRGKVRAADVVVVGSFVPGGVEIGEWAIRHAEGVTAFYDIDTPVTLASVESDTCEYLSRALIPRYDLYLSFTGGPMLDRLRRDFGARRARPLYCGVDPGLYRPSRSTHRYDLGYMGTYSPDRQPALEALLLEPARAWPEGRFIVAGSQYPDGCPWPANTVRIDHLSPSGHARFYNQQRFTLNLTRSEMVRTGFAPSVRLFEAAACGTPIITDHWQGLETFFVPGREVVVAASCEDVLRTIVDMPPALRHRIGQLGRKRVLRQHTAEHRAREFESYVREA